MPHPLAAELGWPRAGVALGLGLCIDLATHQAAQAAVQTGGVITDMPPVAGALGGLVGALVHIMAALLVSAPGRPQPQPRRHPAGGPVRDRGGLHHGGVLGLSTAAALPFVPTTSTPLAGFGIGVFAWAMAPGVIAGMRPRRLAQAVARAALGRLSTWLSEPGDGNEGTST
jgi:hypothetical protein